MTILFSGNDFKYEIEAVAKLFFGAEKFSFVYEGDISEFDGDIISVKRTTENQDTSLSVSVRLSDKTFTMSDTVLLSSDNYDNQCEFKLCRLLYLCLKKLTDITPSWGILTGIRPVKKVNALIDDGKTKEEISEYLKDKYFVSDDKINLSYITSVTQKPLLSVPQKSFSLYVSIPFCPTRCSYCSFVSHSMESAVKLIPDYIEKLCEEIKITADIAKKLGLSLDTIYFGGGTPTSIEASQLDRIMTAVSDCFNLSHLREYTVEAGRADTITREKLEVILKNGADRISINPQTMNDNVLKAIGRNHTSEQTIKAYYLAREIGFKNINMDLIAGLPTDDFESFKTSVQKVIDLNPENITVHTLTLKRSSSLFENKNEVKDISVSEMTDYSQKAIIANGYNPYYLYRQKNTLENLENVGYSKKGFESLYNIFIMEEIQSIFAVGAAASTKLFDINSGKIQRVCNYKFPYEYIGRFDKLMEKKKEIINFYNQY